MKNSRMRTMVGFAALALILSGCGGGGGGGGGGAQPLTELSADVGPAYYKMDLAFSGTGEGLACWLRDDGAGRRLFYAECLGGSWSSPQAVGDVESYIYDARVATNGSDVLLAWTDGSHVMAATWNPAGGLGPASAVSGLAAYEVAAGSNGSGYLLAFTVYQSGDYNLYGSIYSGSSWAAAETLENFSESVYTPTVLSDGVGYAVFWRSTANLYAVVRGASSWGPAQVLDARPENVFPEFQAAARKGGNGYAAVWLQSDGSVTSVWGNIYQGSSWSGADTLLTTAYEPMFDPRVASDGNGYCAVWSQSEGSYMRVWAARSSGSAWGPAGKVNPTAGSNALMSSVASSGSGFVAVWQQYVSPEVDLLSSSFNGSTWSTPQTVMTDCGAAATPVIASDGVTYALAAEAQSESGTYSVRAAVLRNGAWTSPTTYAVAGTFFYNSKVGLEPASRGGGYGAFWVGKAAADRLRVEAALAPAGGSWQASRTLSPTGERGACIYPAVARDGSGRLLAVWQQYNGFLTAPQVYGRMDSGDGWSAPFAIGGQYSSYPKVASLGTGFMVGYAVNYSLVAFRVCDAPGVMGSEVSVREGGTVYQVSLACREGTCAAAWREYGVSTYDVYAAVYHGNAWSNAETLENLAGDASEPIAAVAGSTCLAAWEHADSGDYSIYGAVYKGGNWTPPVALEGTANAAYSPQAESSAHGYLVAWYQENGSATDVMGAIYGGSAWTPARTLDNRTDDAFAPQVATDDTGYIVGWQQYAGTSYKPFCAIFDGSSWAPAETIESGSGQVYAVPALASDGAGYVAAWPQYVGPIQRAYAARWDGLAWSPAQALAAGSDDAYGVVTAASDGDGYAVLWAARAPGVTDTWDLWGARFTGATWGAGRLLEEGSGTVIEDYGYFRNRFPIAAAGPGDYAALWLQRNSYGTIGLWAHRGF